MPNHSGSQPAPGSIRTPAHHTVGSRRSNAYRGWGPAAFWPAGARWRGIVSFLLILAVYVGSARLVPWFDGIGLLWLPNAVLAAALLRFRPRDWPYVYSAGVLAEVVTTLNSGWGLHQILSLGILNSAEATLFVLVAARIAAGRNDVGLLSVRGAVAVVIASGRSQHRRAKLTERPLIRRPPPRLRPPPWLARRSIPEWSRRTSRARRARP